MQLDLAQLVKSGRLSTAKWNATIVLCAWLMDHPHKREPDKKRVMQLMGIHEATFYRGLAGVRQIVSLCGEQTTQATHAKPRSSSPCERSKL